MRNKGPGRLRRRWQSLSPRTRKIVVGTVGGGFLSMFVLAGVVYATTDVPLPEDVVRAQSAVVLYADGSRLGVMQGEENRVDVPLAKIPDPVRKAVLAAEDESFYDHSGVSPSGIGRAVVANVRGGRTQGGSTITQQYVKNAFLTRERTLSRKFREVVIAVKLERSYSKDQILEFYLNTIYFGRGAYGIEAASRAYFGVPAEKLTVEQGAVLAALIRSPERGDPARDKATAEKRWRAVLDNMVEEKWLDDARAKAMKFPATQGRNTRNRLAGQTGFVFSEVERELEAAGFDPAKLYTGVTIKTTLLPKPQRAAEAAVPAVLKDVPPELRTALVAVEPGTGKIRALYGGRDFVRTQLNYATQIQRQPGSSFKPYVLAAAIDEGIGLRSRYDGRSPQTFAGDYEVDNFDNKSFGRVDLMQATEDSVNTAYVGLAEDVGPRDVIALARKAGIPEDRKLPADLSLALGTGEISPLDQAVGFATFAAKGESARPFIVESVTKGDKEIYKAAVEKQRAVDEDIAADVTHAMRKVVDAGTGTRARLDGRPAAGKTGTTQSNADAWFVGYTPQLSAAVWMGFDDQQRKLVGIQGRTVTGGTFPAPIWKAFMDAALDGEPVLDFPPPAFAGRDRDAATPSATPSSPTPTPSVTVTVTVEPTLPPLPTGKPSETKSEKPKSEEPTPEPTTSPSGGAQDVDPTASQGAAPPGG